MATPSGWNKSPLACLVDLIQGAGSGEACALRALRVW